MTATFDDVRRIALGLPEAEEVIAWETEVTFRVRNKIFVMEQDRQAHASLKATPMLQEDLVERDPADVRAGCLCRAVRLGRR